MVNILCKLDNTWDMAGKVVRSTDNDASVTPGTSCHVCVRWAVKIALFKMLS